MSLLVKNIGQLVTVCEHGEEFLAGGGMKSVSVMEGVLAVAVGEDGRITAVGEQEKVVSDFAEAGFRRVVDASGCCVLPGLIDGHTHPVWAGERVGEFAMKLAGASYMEVHEAGGGINFTVEKTREASEDTLLKLLEPRLRTMIRSGTTTVECKSGYGLNTETEIKMLRVLERAKKNLPIEISTTFCGAHSVPRGMTADEATHDVIENQLKAVIRENKLGNLNVENIDVFCEKGVFDIEQSRKILLAGKAAGLTINFHGDELFPLGGAEMGAEIGARSISHLEEISEAGCCQMAEAGSVAVILPTTAYILRLNPPPVRKLIQAGAIVALGSDFNPNAHCMSMPLVMHLACVNLRMTLAEALAAATINAAHSIGRGKTHGSLEVGKVGDLLVLREKRWEHLIYQLGDTNIIKHVIKNGKIILTN